MRDRLQDLDRERALALDRRVLLTRRLARAGGDSSAACEYRTLLARLYAAIRDVTGARVVVDTSKAPAYALALRRLPGIELSVVHLVRDPRGTAFSRLRDPRPEDTGLAASVLLWNGWNLLAERWFGGPRYLRVRHEDFVARPNDTIAEVLRAAGEPARGLVAPDGRTLLPTNHSVAGNAARFRVGEVRIAPDEAWRHSLGRGQRAVVAALSWPLVRRYGYAPPLRSARRDKALPTATRES